MRGKHLYKLVIVLLFAVGFVSFSPSALAYGDSDNIPGSVENASPNNGDNNYDTIKDKKQDDVATTTNPNDIEAPNSYVSLEITNQGEGPNWQIDEFNPVDPATLPSQPDGTVFPVGMFDVKLSSNGCGCHNEQVVERSIVSTDSVVVGDTVHLKLIFDRLLDTSRWTTQKYDSATDTYYDYSPYVTISTQLYGETLRTVLEWTIVDGGLGDEDGLVNCSISDPIGPTILPTATSTSALIVPAAKTTTVTGPTLANTGLGTNVLISIAVLFIAAAVVVFPKRAQR
ncbi:MAG: choice-of-anchor U domain-containing protein [Candidatus Saccharibacteria bacterium]|nr:choice-of-anchor U domain-containing protein [Candidatus Saccharibacteria bacterium]